MTTITWTLLIIVAAFVALFEIAPPIERWLRKTRDWLQRRLDDLDEPKDEE